MVVGSVGSIENFEFYSSKGESGLSDEMNNKALSNKLLVDKVNGSDRAIELDTGIPFLFEGESEFDPTITIISDSGDVIAVPHPRDQVAELPNSDIPTYDLIISYPGFDLTVPLPQNMIDQPFIGPIETGSDGSPDYILKIPVGDGYELNIKISIPSDRVVQSPDEIEVVFDNEDGIGYKNSADFSNISL